MNNKIELVLFDSTQIEIPVSVMHNDLDYAKIRVILLLTALLIAYHVNK